MTSDQTVVDTIHAAQIGLRFRLEHPQPRRAPPASQVDSQTAILGESVSNPVGTKPVFHYDDDLAIVVEVPDRDSVAPAGPPAERLDDERVLPRIGRTRYTGDDREARDRIRDSD